MADEILNGANSSDSAYGIELPAGDHEITYDLDILLKHGRYSSSITLGADDNSVFGNIPRFATPEPQAFFDVLGNTGSPLLWSIQNPDEACIGIT